MKKKADRTKRIVNRRASHDYALDDSIVVGIVLNGRETKALRMGHGNLRGAYVTVKDNELWLINASINSAPGIILTEEEQTQSRKLLLKRKEIDNFITKKQQGLTIVPTELLTNTRYIKVRIASGRGKKLYDKRHTLKAKDQKRSIDAKLKQISR